MPLTERERLILHITQLANSKSHDKLDMHLGSAVNIIMKNRCRNVTKEEFEEIRDDVFEELSFSSAVYEEYDIK